MMKIPFLTLICLVLTCIYSCDRHSISALEEINSYIQEDPERALSELVRIDQSSLRSPAQKARYSLLYSMALDKNYIDTTDLSIIEPAVRYYSHHGSADDRIKALYYQGRIYDNIDEYNKAIVILTQATQLLDKAKDYKYCAMVYMLMSNIYINCYSEDESLSALEKASHYAQKTGDNPLINHIEYLTANTYSNQYKYAIADSLYRRIIADTSNTEFRRMKAKSNLAFAIINSDNPDYETAYRYFTEALQYLGKFGSENMYGAYAYTAYRAGDHETSESIFNMMETEGMEEWANVWKSPIAFQKGDYKNAYIMREKEFKTQNKILNETLKQSAVRAQKDYLELQYETTRTSMQMQRLTLLLIISVLIIISMIVFHILRQRNERIRQEKECELSALRSEYYNIYKSQFKYFGYMCEAYYNAAASSNPQKTLYEKIRKKIMDISGEKGMKQLEKTLDEKLDNMMSDFRRDFPTLDEADYRLAGYIFAGFDATIIMIMMDMPSQASVHTRKSRLKKIISTSDIPGKERYLRMFSSQKQPTPNEDRVS